MKRPTAGVQIHVDEHLLPESIMVDVAWAPLDLGGSLMAAYQRAVRARVRSSWQQSPRLRAEDRFVWCDLDAADDTVDDAAATEVPVSATGRCGDIDIRVETDRFGLTAVEVAPDWCEHGVRVDEIVDEILRCVDDLRPQYAQPHLAVELMMHELAL
ncbi:MAG: hypothetical protein GX542_13935 [Rhodococcus sp.]|nr:hypothetical protein [Rhodococcus sp. (in: high G+C Gram-positive bacteria)]